MKGVGIKRLSIVAILLLSLSGCSSYRLAYNNLDHLVFAWIDDYADLTSAQRDRLRPQLLQWHDRHRQEELPRYQALLISIRMGVQSSPLDTALFDGWRAALEESMQTLRSSAVPLAVALLEQLDSSQQRQLLDTLRREIKNQREDALDRSASEQAERRYEKYRQRMYPWIGRLDDPQRQHLKRLLEKLPDTELQWLAYRSRWVDRLEQALLFRSDQAQFYPRIESLLLNASPLYRASRSGLQGLKLADDAWVNESLIEERSIADSRQLRIRYMLALINSLSEQQRSRLLQELDELIDVVAELQRQN